MYDDIISTIITIIIGILIIFINNQKNKNKNTFYGLPPGNKYPAVSVNNLGNNLKMV